jgi:hypothetical protein
MLHDTYCQCNLMSTYTKWIFKYGCTFHKSRQWWCGVFVFRSPCPSGCWMISGQLRGFPCWVPQVLTILSSADVTAMSPSATQRNLAGEQTLTWPWITELVVLAKNTIFWDVTPWILVGVHWHWWEKSVNVPSFLCLLLICLGLYVLWPWRWRRNILTKRR